MSDADITFLQEVAVHAVNMQMVRHSLTRGH